MAYVQSNRLRGDGGRVSGRNMEGANSWLFIDREAFPSLLSPLCCKPLQLGDADVAMPNDISILHHQGKEDVGVTKGGFDISQLQQRPPVSKSSSRW